MTADGIGLQNGDARAPLRQQICRQTASYAPPGTTASLAPAVIPPTLPENQLGCFGNAGL